METIYFEICKLIDEAFLDKFGAISWHYDGAMENRIMEREKRDLKFEVRELIEERLKDLDNDIEEWKKENQEEWDAKDFEDMKIDLLYERNQEAV